MLSFTSPYQKSSTMQAKWSLALYISIASSLALTSNSTSSSQENNRSNGARATESVRGSIQLSSTPTKRNSYSLSFPINYNLDNMTSHSPYCYPQVYLRAYTTTLRIISSILFLPISLLLTQRALFNLSKGSSMSGSFADYRTRLTRSVEGERLFVGVAVA